MKAIFWYTNIGYSSDTHTHAYIHFKCNKICSLTITTDSVLVLAEFKCIQYMKDENI